MENNMQMDAKVINDRAANKILCKLIEQNRELKEYYSYLADGHHRLSKDQVQIVIDASEREVEILEYILKLIEDDRR